MTYQKVNGSIVSKDAMNSFNEMFPLARMFPLAVMHTPHTPQKKTTLKKPSPIRVNLYYLN